MLSSPLPGFSIPKNTKQDANPYSFLVGFETLYKRYHLVSYSATWLFTGYVARLIKVINNNHYNLLVLVVSHYTYLWSYLVLNGNFIIYCVCMLPFPPRDRTCISCVSCVAGGSLLLNCRGSPIIHWDTYCYYPCVKREETEAQRR